MENTALHYLVIWYALVPGTVPGRGPTFIVKRGKILAVRIPVEMVF